MIENEDDTPLNAIVHCVFQCKLAASTVCGERRAKRIGDLHEAGPKNTPNKKEMDLCNNEVGREVARGTSGTWEECFAGCERKVNDCNLCWLKGINTDLTYNAFGISLFSSCKSNNKCLRGSP